MGELRRDEQVSPSRGSRGSVCSHARDGLCLSSTCTVCGAARGPLQRPGGVLPDAAGGARATGDTGRRDTGEEWEDAKPRGQDTAGRQPAARGMGRRGLSLGG